MNRAIIGFPRIGEQRELKKATEQYLQGKIDQSELQATAKSLRLKNWNLIKSKGINHIPSNDFSFYDTMLDTVCMLGVIPKRYKKLNLNQLDTFFAMAKGHQSSSGDVHALEMKKWFNTNYHYISPEIEDATFDPNPEKLLSEYKEAEEAGITTIPTLIGPFTFLQHAKLKTDVTKNEIAEAIANAYTDILDKINQQGIKEIQLEEPCLVRDLTSEEIALFINLHKKFLSQKGECQINLITYFGDLRDIYSELIQLDYNGIGVDLIEGPGNIELIKKMPPPKGMRLFAGLINGKNIWHNDYKKTLSILEQLSKVITKKDIILNTSCSLLHVPYTTRHEKKMDPKFKQHLAFAEEKLEELQEVSQLAENDAPERQPAFIKNQKLIQEKRSSNTPRQHTEKLFEQLSQNEINRLPIFSDRNKLQKQKFNLPLLPTTTIGSFPQTPEIRKLRRDYKQGNISQENYEEAIRQKIADVIKLQEEIGIDVLVHGEFERNDMVEYFGENLEGFLFTENGWVQSYGTRGVKPPIIFGDVWRKQPITVAWSSYAQSLTPKPVKGMLTGPVTILNWSFPREDISLKQIVFQIALAIKEEVLDLEQAGINIIQIDEAALREKLPLRKADWDTAYLDWAIKAFRIVHEKVKAETQIHTHMCYSEFKDILPQISKMDADVITIESAKSDLSMLDHLKAANYDKEVGPGVYDIHSPRVPSIEELQTIIKKMCEKLEKSRLWVNPDCGLKTRKEEETIASLKNMVAAAKSQR